MPETFIDTTVYEIHDCPSCGVLYAAPKQFFARKSRENAGWFCVNGHSLKFTKSELQRTKEELARVESDRAWLANRERSEREARERAERSAVALRGHLTRMRKRIAAGICPVPGCRRSGFTKVRAHLASKHPEWLAEHACEIDA